MEQIEGQELGNPIILLTLDVINYLFNLLLSQPYILSLNLTNYLSYGKPLKNIFLVTRPLRGGGVRAWPLRKSTFFEALKKIPP